MTLLSCSECKQQVSDQAIACPHCGFQLKPSTQPKSRFAKDIEDIKRVGYWLAFVITLPSLSVPAIVSTLLDPGEFGGETIETLSTNFFLTAPLTCAIALIGIWIVPVTRKYLSEQGTLTYPNVLGIGFGVLFSLWIAAQASKLLLNAQGVDVVTVYNETDTDISLIKILLSLWNILAEYFRFYGFHKFLSSFAIGIFLAWIWNNKILKYFSN